MQHNCLTYALDRWHRHGGYLSLRKSTHWALPHVRHIGDTGLHHYAPPEPLKHPSLALFGFHGAVRNTDLSPAPPVPLRGIVFGSWYLAAAVTVWALGVVIKRMRICA